MAWTPQFNVRTRGQGTFSRTATMQVRTIWDTQAHAVQVAKECVFISGPFSMPNMAAMIAANPQLVFAPYLKSIQNPATTGAFDAAGTKYPNKWYVHFKDGTKAKQGGQFVNWLMESGFWTESRAAATVTGPLSNTSVSANSWAEYHVRDAVAKVNQVNAQGAQNGTHPMRGLWFDSDDTFSADATSGFWTSTNPGWNPHTLAAYTKPDFVSMAHWIGDMAQNLTPAGVVNPERLWTAANGLRSVSIADHYDMAMAEGWMVSGGLGGSMTRGTAGWEHSVDLALQCQAKGCVAEILEWGLAGDTLAVTRQKRRFVLGSYLIANRGLMTVEFGATKAQRPDLESALDVAMYGDTSTGGSNQPLDLGAPLTGQSPATAAGHAVATGTGNGQASAAGLYARLYDGGTVLVNPTASSINYKASKSYTLVPDPGASGASYVAGNLIAVAAGHAVFLTTTSGGTGGTAPTVTLAPYVLGTARDGQTVYIQPGVYAGSPTPTLTRQWQSSADGSTGWTNISGATANNYTIPIGSGGTPTTYAADAFTRTVTGGWGSADTGGAWTTTQGNAADADTSGTRGEMTLAANTTHREQLAINKADLDAKVTMSFKNLMTGGPLHASLDVREQDTSNYYRLNLVGNAGTSHISVNPDKVIAGVSSSLGTAKDLGTYTGGTNVTVRIRMSGTNLKAKAWLTSGSEPSSWDWDVTDSAITAAGNLSLRGFRSTTNTNTTGPQVRFDDLSAVSLSVSGGTGFTGQYLRVQETATNSAGNVVGNSPAFGALASGASTDPMWTAPPSISGSATEGTTLTANQGTISGFGTATGGSGGSSVFPSSGALWGEYTDTSNNGLTHPSISTIQAREATMGRPFDLCLLFGSSNPNASTSPITTGVAQWALRNKHVVLLSTSFGWGNSAFPGYSSVTSGAQDSIIDNWSTALINLQSLGTVILRQFQEMNGNWFNYSAGQNTSTYNPGFVNMWKYIVDRYIANGVDIHGKVLMNWCPNTETNIAAITATITDNMYPGDSYVDVIGIDLYNKDSNFSGVGMSFQSGFSTIYGRYAATGKPFIAAETASVDHKLDQRANWLTAARNYIKGGTVPLIKGFCYWDAIGTAADKSYTVTSSTGAQINEPFEYRVDQSGPNNATSSADSLAAYKAMGNDPYFSGGGTLTPSVAYQWETSSTGASGSWSNVSGATDQTYVLPSGSAGSYYRVKVTAATSSATVSMWSRETAQVTGGDVFPTNTTAPTIAGTATVGQTLTLTPGVWTGSPQPSTNPVWQSSGDNGATWTSLGSSGSTYVLKTNDQGDLISVLETSTNRAGTATQRSNTLGPVATPSGFPNLTLQVAVE